MALMMVLLVVMVRIAMLIRVVVRWMVKWMFGLAAMTLRIVAMDGTLLQLFHGMFVVFFQLTKPLLRRLACNIRMQHLHFSKVSRADLGLGCC